MKKIILGLLVLASGVGMRAKADTVVLAPGESRVVGGENVVCSVNQASSFAKAYYSCSPWTVGTFPYSDLTITTNSELGRGLTLTTTMTSDDCNSTRATLAAKRSTTTKYTEIAVCGLTFGDNSSTVHLYTYALTINGGLSLVNTDDSIASEADCLAKANAINSAP